jgi:MarR family transcriptional regulator, lower aerobic nicotinate degradation pathway regulator
MMADRSVGPEVGLLLRLAHQRASREFSRELAPLEIEGKHFGVLMTLARLGPASQTRLIGELGSDKTAMTRTVDALERQGLVVRRPAPNDRRARTVELTPQGRSRLAEASEVAKRVSADLLACLSAEEQATLHGLLARFVAADSLASPSHGW